MEAAGRASRGNTWHASGLNSLLLSLKTLQTHLSLLLSLSLSHFLSSNLLYQCRTDIWRMSLLSGKTFRFVHLLCLCSLLYLVCLRLSGCKIWGEGISVTIMYISSNTDQLYFFVNVKKIIVNFIIVKNVFVSIISENVNLPIKTEPRPSDQCLTIMEMVLWLEHVIGWWSCSNGHNNLHITPVNLQPIPQPPQTPLHLQTLTLKIMRYWVLSNRSSCIIKTLSTGFM